MKLPRQMQQRLVWGVLLAALLGLALWFVLRPERGSSDAGKAAVALDAAGAASAVDPSAATQGPEEPKVIQAVAASGGPIRVTRSPRIDVPAPPYGPKLAEMFAASDSGDPAARFRLGLMLYQCRDVPADAPGLARAVEEIHQTRSRDGWEVADPAQEEDALRTLYANCAGVPAPARVQYRELMLAAAHAGLIDAQLNLMFHLPPGKYCQFIEDCTPEQAQRMLSLREAAKLQVGKALEAGSVEALRTVGGWALNEEMGTPDEVEAYAHFSAYDQVQRALGRERELTAMLAGLESRLRPVDLERAETRAKELLANPRCCVLTR